MALFGSLGEVNVGALSATTTDNAVDVFVYDTRKDSDGGQWRKRTQHTSWYNETLNTATRGSRKDFPAVAVLVLETGKLTIYDGDDPDMPMWMIFNTTDGSMLRSGVMTSIVMMNGEFWVGHDSGSGLHWVNFLKDTARWITASSSYGGFFKKTSIIFRNDAGANYDNNIGGASDVFIAGSSIKDLAMTVLPNAPIDSATGLPVPTIAVATQQGISIITDSGTIYNLTPESDPSYASIKNFYSVGFDSTNKIFFTDSQTTSGYSALIYLPSYNYNQSLTDYYSSLTGSYNYVWGGDIRSTSTPVGTWNASSTTRLITESIGTKDSIAIGYIGSSAGDGGLSLIGQQNNYLMNCKITTSYNTGWMYGYTQGAWLSDTSTASVTGTELITNGTFDSNTTGWTANTSTNTWSSGTMQITRTGGGGLTTYQTITTVAGQRYVATAQVNSSGSRGDMYAVNGTGWGGTTLGGALGTSGQTRTLTVTFVATSTATTLGFTIDSISTSISVDNVSVRLAEADRSVNNNGLAVYGTITKSPVATGSNLVAYSGWSNSNYLRRPPGGTDLNNSSITYMCWYKGGGYNGEEAPVSTGDYNVINAVRGIYINPSGIAGFSGWANDFNPGSFNVRDYVWHHICVTIQYISGTTYTISVYVDGRLTGSTNRELSTFTNTAIDVGGGTLPGTRYTIGSLSLVRVSTTIPSPEQIRKIYEDEKALFQPNSQCTLYGSSDAVTALAYDDTYQILSVGTSSGRSDFRGLERINNTTTAVTTAISASNGLIAEQ
jgi:hypothetical protein